jgi:predicted metal-binding protein
MATIPPGSNSVLFGKESNFRPSIPPAARQTETVCIVCRQDSEDTNEYAEADCTLFKMGVTGLGVAKTSNGAVLLRFEAFSRRDN